MAIRVALHHSTRYVYDRPVTLSPHVVRLRPAPHSRTHISAYSLRVTPEKHFIHWQQDPYGNHLARLVFPEQTRELRRWQTGTAVAAALRVARTSDGPVVAILPDAWDRYRSQPWAVTS